jgi:ABC-2 type transport system permease protein
MIIAKKIIRDLTKEKTFVFVLLMQIILIASITLILSFTAVFFSPESLIAGRLNIGTINLDETGLFVRDQKLKLINYDDPNFDEPENLLRGIEDIEQGKLDSLIVLEEGIFIVYLPDSDIQASLILSYIKERFEILENKMLLEYTSVIDINRIRVIGERNKGSDYIYEILYGFLIPFIFLIPIFLVGSLIIDITTQEIESKTLNLLATTIDLKRYFNEVIIGSLILSLLQIILWLILIQLRNIPIMNIIPLIIYLSLFSILISSISLLIAVKFKTKSRSQLIYSVLIMIISVSIGISQINPVAFISTIISGIIIAPLYGYLLILFLFIITYYILIKSSLKEFFL